MRIQIIPNSFKDSCKATENPSSLDSRDGRRAQDKAVSYLDIEGGYLKSFANVIDGC